MGCSLVTCITQARANKWSSILFWCKLAGDTLMYTWNCLFPSSALASFCVLCTPAPPLVSLCQHRLLLWRTVSQYLHMTSTYQINSWQFSSNSIQPQIRVRLPSTAQSLCPLISPLLSCSLSTSHCSYPWSDLGILWLLPALSDTYYGFLRTPSVRDQAAWV